MKKVFLLTMMSILFQALAGAQVVIDMSMYQSTQNVRLKFRLQDAKSGDPLRYASVYLIPQGDTLIKHFVLSDEKGSVEIPDIVPGRYEVNAEMIGYNPYKKIQELKGWEKDLGTVRLEENPEYIDASSITAVGNPVKVMKDSIEYNAAAFHVGANAVLEDLLKKMPGMEVDKAGNVKVNGAPVDKITVGGKTFFFNDPTVAVKNLPAKIVDKIRVIDKDKESATFTGVSTRNDKEKVMDVRLKEEYAQGWFGNLKLNGGASLGSDSGSELTKIDGGLFNAGGLLAGYDEKDQVTLIGNAKNVEAPGSDASVVVRYSGGGDNSLPDGLASKRGLTTTAQTGVNYNTERLKEFDVNAGISYGFSRKDVREQSARTSFMPEGADLFTDAFFKGIGDDNKLNASVTLEKKDKSKYMMLLRPELRFTSQDRNIANTSNTMSEGTETNRSSSLGSSRARGVNPYLYYSLGVKDLGRKGRSLTFNGTLDHMRGRSNSTEFSETVHAGATDVRNLLYDQNIRGHGLDGTLTYSEPIGEKWTAQVRSRVLYNARSGDKAAFNGTDGSANDYYSSYTRNTDLRFMEYLLLQYRTGPSVISAGTQLMQEKNYTESKALGVKTVTGKDEWLFHVAPSAEIRWSGNGTNLLVYYNGYGNPPSHGQLTPALDINNPVLISAGNIYLRPSFRHMATLNLDRNNPKIFSMASLYGNVTLQRNPVVSASWFDDHGIRYAIPVNARKNGVVGYVQGLLRLPLDKKKRWTASVTGTVDFSWNTGYQARTRLPGIDLEQFSYEELMSWFWGEDKRGDRFYGGDSGFSESRTRTMSYTLRTRLEYRRDRLSARLLGNVTNRVTRYSLDPDANLHTWDGLVSGQVLYETETGWEFGSDVEYRFFRGYTAGYGAPELIGNIQVNKSVKSLTFTLKVADLLNQGRSLHRTESGEYVEDTYRYALGRYFLAGVTFNFGKMNARNTRTAQNALLRMSM